MDSVEKDKWTTAREPLLDQLDQEDGQSDQQSTEGTSTLKLHQKSLKRLRIYFYLLVVAYAPLVALYVWLYTKFQASEHSSHCKAADIFPSLADSQVVKYESRYLDVNIHGNKYAGAPRPELDAAWHDLFEDVNIPVSKEDLEYYNVTSIPLADGSGYAAQLGVHHELHCLKKIRHWIYKDYYLKNETEEELIEWDAHIDHCIEMLRETAVCRASPALSTFKWVGSNPPALTAVAVGQHQCVNWESLISWVNERHIPVFENPGMLQQPDDL